MPHEGVHPLVVVAVERNKLHLEPRNVLVAEKGGEQRPDVAKTPDDRVSSVPSFLLGSSVSVCADLVLRERHPRDLRTGESHECIDGNLERQGSVVFIRFSSYMQG